MWWHKLWPSVSCHWYTLFGADPNNCPRCWHLHLIRQIPSCNYLSRLNTAREHSPAQECNHLCSSVLEWCWNYPGLKQPALSQCIPESGSGCSTSQGPFQMVGLDAAILPQRGIFMATDTDRLCQLDPELEAGPWHCLVYQESHTHSSPIPAVTGRTQWSTKMRPDVPSWQNIYSPDGSEPFQYHSMGKQCGKGRNKTIFPAGSFQMLHAPATTVTPGLVWFFDCFFPVCVPSILLFVVVGLGLFICLFFISFGLVSYFWFQYGYVDLGFFS